MLFLPLISIVYGGFLPAGRILAGAGGMGPRHFRGGDAAARRDGTGPGGAGEDRLRRQRVARASDAGRGDPRGSRSKKTNAAAQGLGDCIDCTQCVTVCPMGDNVLVQGFPVWTVQA